MNRTLIAGSLLAFMFILSFAILVYQHEQTHKAIYDLYKINSTVHYGILESYVITTSAIPAEDTRPVRSLQSLNEVVFYQYQALFFYMFAMSMAFVVILYGWTG